MLQDVLRDMDLSVYPVVAMVIFLGVFLLVVLRVMRPGQDRAMKRAANMPLHDGMDLEEPQNSAEVR